MRLMAALTLLAATATAHADPPGMTAPLMAGAPVDRDTGSYRLQTALCDAASLALFSMAAKSEDGDAAATLGLVTYVSAAPIVHLFHHHTGRAAASLALRVGLPLVLGAIGSAVGKSQCGDGECDNDSDIVGAAYGILGGAIAASVIDIAYLSRGESAAPASQAAVVPPPVPIGPAEPHQVRVGVTFAF